MSQEAADDQAQDGADKTSHIGHGMHGKTFDLLEDNGGQAQFGYAGQDEDPHPAAHVQYGVIVGPVKDHDRDSQTYQPLHAFVL